MISKLEIKLPGYDTKIPKVVLEYRESTYDEKLKKYVQDNIGILINKIFYWNYYFRLIWSVPVSQWI